MMVMVKFKGSSPGFDTRLPRLKFEPGGKADVSQEEASLLCENSDFEVVGVKKDRSKEKEKSLKERLEGMTEDEINDWAARELPGLSINPHRERKDKIIRKILKEVE